MTMHLLPVYYTTTQYNRKEAKKPKQLSKHDAWLWKRGLHPEQIKLAKDKKILANEFFSNYSRDMKVDRDDYVSLGMSGDSTSTVNRSIMNNLHKEPEHVRKEIINKSKRVAIAYNKGGYIYVTDGADPTDIGKKK